MADQERNVRMEEIPEPDERRVQKRAQAAIEEGDSGSPDDPEAQARALLEESDARTEDPAAGDPKDENVDHRTSDDATAPLDP